MSSKPTYEELEQKIKELERAHSNCRKEQEVLSEQLLRQNSLMEASLDGIAIIDQSHRVRHSNRQFAQMLGYTSEEVLRLYTWDWECTMTEAEIRKSFSDLSKTKTTFETCHRRKDGTIYNAEVTACGAKLGQESMILAITRDISQRKAAESALQLSEARTKWLSEATFEAIFLCEKGICFDQNIAAEKMFGYNNEAAVGKPIANWFAPVDRDQAVKKMTKDKATPYEIIALRKDGSTFPCEILSRTFVKEERIIHSIALRDLSRQKEDQVKITHTNNLLRYIIEHTNSAVAVHDKDLKYIYVSQNYLDQYKIKEKDVIGRHHYEVFPDLPQKWRDVHQRALVGQTSSADRDIYPRDDGTVEWTRWECRPWYEAGGSIGGFIVYTEVITDRIEAEEALREREESLKALIESSPSPIISITPAGLVKTWNTAAERTFGWNAEDVIGHVLPIVPKEKQVEFGNFQKQIRTGKSFSQIELTRVCKDGSQIEVSLSTAPIRNNEGKLVAIMGVFEDITERKRAEIALSESETRYRNLAENSPAVAFQFHMSQEGDFSIPYISEQVYPLTGISARQAMQDSSDLIGLIQPDKQQLFRQNVIESARLLQPFHNFFKIHAAGSSKWLEVRSTPQREKDGSTTWNGFFHDVTERILTEKALQESEWKFQALFTNGPIGVAYHRMVYDQDGKAVDYYFIDANQKYLELTGVDPRKKFVTEAFPGIENDPFDWIGTFGDVARHGKSIRFQQHLKPNDRWYDCVGYQYQPDHFVAAFFEITEQKKIELQLEKEEKQFRTLFEKSNDAMFIIDRRSGQYLNANNAALELTGRTLEELCRLTIHDVTPKQSNERIKAVSENSKVLKFGEVIYKRPDGTERVAILTSVPLDDNRVYGIARDITDTLLLERQLDQAQKLESVGRLAGGVAHDFNNMLSVIIGYTEMGLEDIEKDSILYERLEEIRKAAERSADLTRQLLAFARKQTISPKVIDLNKNIEGTLKMLKRLIGEDIDLKWVPCKELWPIKVDPSQIDQILTNLCVNSRDAIKDVGKITIETDTVALDESCCPNHPGSIPGEYILLAVSDNGSGMAGETLSKIFEPFFTTKEPGQGTGLGLATVYGAVKQNQGFINVSSEPDQGTTFKIYLPRYAAKAESFTGEIKERSLRKGQETILLVEDESAILNMTTTMLERLGYQVLAADTPGKAIRLAQEYEGEIHLLLTDVIMPEMNGRDLAKNILSLYPHLRRLFMSGYTANVIAHHGVLDEGVNFINKPFSVNNLGVKVREILDKGDL